MIEHFDEQLKKIISEHAFLDVNVDDIHDDTDLIKDLRYNSFQFVELLAYIEIEFGIDVGIENIGMNAAADYASFRTFIASFL